ncbi:aminotransferase class I/II-fold pyridoxal phosphate-dependent enzyme [Rhodocaloribacter litoris]|uniref:trans-sulfuration enzyme family protein n=1 Tax=Rhodocaloribacter litoris TaxID=2558931 RepID=UPI0014227056|nr:aminotransferase class I/II-fold pyridoxal phosphate-dependent enzyme [Rhodocaloribacter litoris]QXD16830.1 aminotransferase class I/II-fold pyridoxal phosphate-dependent enzyme [Rhodocaloribacter litoris]GIV60529.1 MAG: methionine gamma-lyase [Rhodothermaceae bacterium]
MTRQGDDYQPTTRLIHGRMHSAAWEYSHHVVPPISTSTTFRLDSQVRGAQGFRTYGHEEESGQPIYIYDRLREPNKDLLEENLAMAEGGEMAVTFASGMGAISAVLGVLLRAGEHLVAHHTLYGCTHSLLNNWLPRFGITHTPVDLTTPEALREHLRPATRVVYLETPANPTLEIVDIAAVVAEVAAANAARAPEERVYVVVDNTFATPFCQRPLEHGADFVVHSLTKGISGYGTDMGGVVIGPRTFRDRLLLYRKDFGGVLSPRAAWSILVYGLPSLAVRMRQQQATARELVRFLANHPAVASVSYPGLPSFAGYAVARRQMIDYEGNFAPGSMVFFELRGATPERQQEAGIRFINHLARHAYTVTLAVSLGNVRTLVEHPSSMTHAPIPLEEQIAMGIRPSGIRLSVGLEAVDDLVRDLEAALEAAQVATGAAS